MARQTDAKCRLCRREGVKLFIKGQRCEGEKCALFRRQSKPGQHGAGRTRRRGRTSTYALQLREKQKVKRVYGVLERQFRRYFNTAAKRRGGVGEALLQILESRLDNVVYRLGVGLSRAHCRQLIVHGKIKVNGRPVTVPSYPVSEGDRIETTAALLRPTDLPLWLKWDKRKSQGAFLRPPKREELDPEINEELIVGVY